MILLLGTQAAGGMESLGVTSRAWSPLLLAQGMTEAHSKSLMHHHCLQGREEGEMGKCSDCHHHMWLAPIAHPNWFGARQASGVQKPCVQVTAVTYSGPLCLCKLSHLWVCVEVMAVSLEITYHGRRAGKTQAVEAVPCCPCTSSGCILLLQVSLHISECTYQPPNAH